MSRTRSEIAFGAALRAIDDSVPTFVYRPPDLPGPSQGKPADFMVWGLGDADIAPDLRGKFVDVAWFECKELGAAVAESFPCRLVRPSQRQGIREAMRVGIPYWLAVYWKRHKAWTISDAVRLEATGDLDRTSLQRALLNSRYGIDATPATLTSVLKSLMAGEVS